MNIHIKQVYEFALSKKVPVSELRVYIAAAGIHEEIEWDNDEGYSLMYEESYRYHDIQYYIDRYLPYHLWKIK